MTIDSAGLSSQIKALNQKLSSSDTAYSPGGYSSTDVSNEAKLRKLEALKSTMASNQARSDWYPNETKANVIASKPDAGFVADALDSLQAPLRAVVGGVKYVAGKSTANNVLGAINQNMQTEHDDFSSFLKTMNVPAPVAAPLGFALDLGMDPINWLTLGGGAGAGSLGKFGEKGAAVTMNIDRAIPKLIYGTVKAGPEGAAAAVKSSFWDTVKGVARILPGESRNSTLYNWTNAVEKAGIANTPEVKMITRDMLTTMNEGGTAREVLERSLAQVPQESDWKAAAEKALQDTKIQGVRKKIQNFKTGIAEKATAAKGAYEGALGFSEMNPLIENIVNANAERAKWSDVMRTTISNMGGDKLLQMFDYNPKEWFKIARLKDELYQTKGQAADWAAESRVLEALPEDMRTPAQVERLKELGVQMKNLLPSNPDSVLKGAVEEGNHILTGNADKIRSESLFDNTIRMEGEGIKNEEVLRARANQLIEEGAQPADVEKAFREVTKGDANPDWIDKKVLAMRSSLKEKGWTGAKLTAAEKLLDAYDNIYKTSVGIFKATKVGGKLVSPAAHLNAYIGNHIMAHLAGFDITRGAYQTSLKDAFNFYKGKEAATYIQKILGGEIEQYAKDYPGLFSGMFGFTPNKIKLMRDISNDIDFRVAKGLMKQSEAEALKGEVTYNMTKQMDELRGTSETMKNKVRPGNILEQDAEMKNLAERSGFTSASYIGNELTDAGMVRLRNAVKLRADAGEKWAKAADYILNKGPQEYEMIDQSNRLGLFTHMVKNGLTEPELARVSRMADLHASTDLVKTVVNGENLYKIRPDKANEIVSLVYMNYAAMPGFVRLMRSVPLVGSPFYSFSHGMGAKAIQTMADNPASINKVSNALNSIETLFGGRTPLEKKELDINPNYNWYNKPGMVSLQNFPFFKGNPIFLNAANFIPYMSLNMINPSERKYDATWPGRIAEIIDKSPIFKGPGGNILFDYLVQPQLLGIKEPQNQFGSPLYPKTATGIEKNVVYPLRSLAEAWMPPTAGVAGLVNPLAEENIKYLPSYNMRKVAEAELGKTSVGVAGKESPQSRSIRAILSILGISINPLDLTKAK